MPDTQRLVPYVPRLLLRHLGETPDAPVRVLDGSLVFVDISGFTRLSERLARQGREGAERLADTIDECFTALLAVAYENGGGLLKFGGDALLLLFDGEEHPERACRAAFGMRALLREIGRLDAGGVQVRLRMSVGVHSGECSFFVTRGVHRELLVAGPAATEAVRMEQAADAGQIVVSDATASRLPAGCTSAHEGPGRLLRSAPSARAIAAPEAPRTAPAHLDAVLSPLLRDHLEADAGTPEHRVVTVAFLRVGGLDALLAERGAEVVASALDDLVARTATAAARHGVCLLGSDVDAGAGKLLLAAGAPVATGEDDERMLLALREVLEGGGALPLKIGVHRGAVFAGDIGPPYRRTYTVMGDAVNLAARLMAAAPEGELYATERVVEDSSTRFSVTRMAPFRVKGKARPVEALSVGPAQGGRSHESLLADRRFPLVGRRRETEALEAAIAGVRDGSGRVLDIVGEPGIGKSRLLEELRMRAGDLRGLQVTCEAYAAAVPHVVSRQLLHQVLRMPVDADADHVAARLRAAVSAAEPALEPWLPLLAIPFGLDLPATQVVANLDGEFRRAKLHEVVVTFLRSTLKSPTLIEVEDAHHVDPASAGLLAAVAAAVPEAPWLLALTRREVGPGVAAHAAVERMEPEPLTPDETLALARAATERVPLSPRVLEVVAERSGGNPQFLRDLLRSAARDGVDHLPESIEAAAAARLDRLPAADRRLVQRAAVLGRAFDPALIPFVLDEDAQPPNAATWARLHRYLEPDGEWFLRFRRQVVWEAAYAGLPFRTRRRLHMRTGLELERRKGEDAVLALHFERAADHERAFRYARRAGDAAMRDLAPAEASVAYRRALEAARMLGVPAGKRSELWEALGDAHAQLGELVAGHHSFTAARRLAADEPVRRALLMLRHAELSVEAGRIRPGVRWALRGLRTLDAVEDREAAATRVRLTAMLATLRQRQGRAAEAIALCRTAIPAAEAAGEDRALAHACYVLDWALVESGRAADAGYSDRALAIYRRLGDVGREAAVLNNAGGFAYRDGRWTDAMTLYVQGAEASARSGNSANAAFGDCNVGELLSDQGHWDEAEMLLRRARQVWRGTGYEWGVAYATAQLGRLAARSGHQGHALVRLLDALARFRALGVEGDVQFAEALLAEAAAFAGDGATAEANADRLLAGPDPGLLEPLLHRVKGFALAQRGDVEGATAELRAAVAVARAQHQHYEVLVALDALAALTRLDTGTARRAELSARLGVVRLALPPLATAGTPDPRRRPEPAPR
ncbi:MAG TPA: adenylate/guanylate cyclase domain-containing protein [Solirubrobacteraceae bacterium]|nr:adenylate/guanylate cyclase domain-containing protein [Solirubrobacteraceae bacterium]